MEEKSLGIEIIKITVKHKKLIALVIGFAVLCSVIITSPFIIPPLYEAETTIYPPGAYTSSGLLSTDIRFGSETDINNEIQILSSTILRDSIINKYHLFSHYDIDITSPKKNHKINKEYDDNISISQSRYNSIDIGVYDNDPVTAAAIANDIVKIGDEVKTGIIRKNLKSAFGLISEELNGKMKELSILGDSIILLKHENYTEGTNLQRDHYLLEKQTVDNLRNSIFKIRDADSIYDFDNQFNAVYTSYLKANSEYLTDSGIVMIMHKGLKANDTSLVRKEGELEGTRILVHQLKQKLAKLGQCEKQYNALSDNYFFEKGILGGLKSDYEIATSTFNKEYNSLKLETLKNKYTAELQLFNSIKAKYELALNNLSDQVPASYIVSPAEVPSVKAYPQRVLITLLVIPGAYILMILFFKLSNQFSKLRSLIKD